jgi:lipoyl(octanoyl) transferase
MATKANLLTSEEKLDEAGISLVHSSRGGDITFHGPGQLICYPVFNLNHFQKDVGFYVSII